MVPEGCCPPVLRDALLLKTVDRLEDPLGALPCWPPGCPSWAKTSVLASELPACACSGMPGWSGVSEQLGTEPPETSRWKLELSESRRLLDRLARGSLDCPDFSGEGTCASSLPARGRRCSELCGILPLVGARTPGEVERSSLPCLDVSTSASGIRPGRLLSNVELWKLDGSTVIFTSSRLTLLQAGASGGGASNFFAAARATKSASSITGGA